MPVYKDKERNTWYYLFAKSVNGEKIRQHKRGFRTKAEAQDAERFAISSLTKGTKKKLFYNNITMNQAFEMWLEDKRTKVRVTTLQTNIFKYNITIKPKFGDMMLIRIFPSDVRKWKAELVSHNYENHYTNQAITIFRKTLEYVSKRGHKINDDVLLELDSVKMARIKEERKVWTPEEIDKFLSVFHKDDPFESEYYYYFWVFSKTGMRPNEFRALQKQDIQGDYLNVNKDITSKITGKGDIIQPCKNGSSVRKVIMPKEVMDYLRERTKDYKPNEFIFGKEKAFRETNLIRILNAAAKKAKLEPIVLYGFRHSHATNLIRAGVPIKVVQQRLGHKNAAITISTYWHLLKDDEKKVLEFI